MSVKQLLSILWRRIWLVAIGLIATMIGAAIVVTVIPPRYEATASASVDLGQADPVTGSTMGALTARSIFGNLIGFIESQKLALEVVRRLNLTSDPGLSQSYLSSGSVGQIGVEEWIAGTIAKNVDAKPSDAGLNIIYKSNSAIQAALFANTYMSAFQDMVLATKVAAAQQTATWLEPQMEKLRTDLETARGKLIQFQKSVKLLAPGGADQDVNPLASASTELSSAKAQLLSLETVVSAIDSGQGATQTSLLDSPVLANLKASLSTVSADLGRARVDLGANNPKVQALVAQQKSIQDQMGVEIGNIRRTSQAKIAALKSQIAALQATYTDEYGKMITVQGQRDQLSSMQREIAFRQEQLDNASKSAAAARMQGQLSFTNIQTLDNATPPSSPSFPKIPLVAGLAVGAGIALGVIFALIAEALDRRIRVVSDLDFATAAPLLGVVSKSKRKWSGRPKTKGFTLSFPASSR